MSTMWSEQIKTNYLFFRQFVKKKPETTEAKKRVWTNFKKYIFEIFFIFFLNFGSRCSDALARGK